MADVAISALCDTGPYRVLEDKFPEITLGDIAATKLSEDAFVDLVEDKKDRMLMRMFFREKVKPLLQADPFQRAEGKFADPTLLDLSRSKVISKRFARFTHLTDEIPTAELAARFKGKDLAYVQRIDLSSNDLLDEDMPIIVDFIKSALPNCANVDLSNNRFHGYDPTLQAALYKSLTELLRQEKIQFVDICGNALASVDGAPFFKRLSESPKLFSKLIWIPMLWVEAGRWKSVVPDSPHGLHERIIDAHRGFYK
jgi:hypothetical protein